jgi:hypothetical protein
MGPILNMTQLARRTSTRVPKNYGPRLKDDYANVTPADWAGLVPHRQMFEFGIMARTKAGLSKIVAPYPDNVCCQQCWRWGRKQLRTFDSAVHCEFCHYYSRRLDNRMEKTRLKKEAETLAFQRAYLAALQQANQSGSLDGLRLDCSNPIPADAGTSSSSESD